MSRDRPTPAPPTRTARLLLEPLEPDSAEELEPLRDDALVARTLSVTGLPPVPGLDRRSLETKAEHWRRHGFGLWLLRDRETGEMVGRGGPQWTIIASRLEVELAWAVVSRRWGEGLATELALACMAFAFDGLEIDSVVAFALVDNVASRRVMTKAGMSFERDLRHAGKPHVLYRRRRW